MTDGPDSDAPLDSEPSPVDRRLSFTNERQQRIHDRLRLLSPGPAAFYSDACRLLIDREGLQAASHLIAHLGREIESAIRVVVTGGGRKKSGQGDGHSASINLAVETLGFGHDDPIRTEWAAVTKEPGLHGRAHRENLRAPRPLDLEFAEWWTRFEAVLDIVLRRFEARYHDLLARAEELAAIDSPSPEHRKLLVETLPNQPVVVAHFFDQLSDAGWLPVLREEGYLKPTEAGGGDDTRLAFTFVPQADYLARMAQLPEAAELVTEILLEIPATGHMHADTLLLDAVVELPAQRAAGLIGRISNWLDEGLALIEPAKLGRVIRNLAVGGEGDAALELFGVALEPRPDAERGLLGPSARGGFDDFDSERIVDAAIRELTRARGADALRLACDLLEKAVKLSLRDPEQSLPEDGSESWCPFIEHPGGHRDIRGSLVAAVRDAAWAMVEDDASSASTVLDELRGRGPEVFRRIERHLMADIDAIATDLVEPVLADPALWTSKPITDEFQRLSRARFASMSEEARERVLEVIRNGPDVAEANAAFAPIHGREPTADEERAFVDSWQRDRLALIASSLTEEDAAWLDRLLKEHGPAEDDVRSVQGHWGGPVSPMSPDALSEMDDEALVHHLGEWEGAGGWQEPSREGLAQTLRSSVVADPQRFVALAERFKELDREYVTAVLSGLDEVARSVEVKDWGPALALGWWVVDGPGSAAAESGQDDEWRYCKRTLASLLERGLLAGDGEIPFTERATAWRIIERLAVDTDPAEFSGDDNRNPLDIAINTVRGVALHCTFEYVAWVRRQVHPDAPPTSVATFEGVPEARTLLEQRLEVEVSAAVRSGFATYFPRLVSLDPEWAKGVVSEVFPDEPGRAALRLVAWEAYVAWNRVYTPVFEILRGEYLWAIDGLPSAGRRESSGSDPSNCLAEHVLGLFVWDAVGFGEEDQLLERFLERAPDRVIAHAVSRYGQLLAEAEDDVPEEHLSRLLSLWEQRISAAEQGKATAMHAELNAYGWWFASGQLDVERSLGLLQRGVELLPLVDRDGIVLERLAAVAGEHPEQAIRCVHLLAGGDHGGPMVRFGEVHVRTLLRTAHRTGLAPVREAARHLMGFLVARGHVSLRDALDGLHD